MSTIEPQRQSKTAAMSSSFPKSESTTSLLKTSATKRATHLPERTAENRRSLPQHQHHHHRPTALHSNSPVEQESLWPAEGDISARRPLCHPSLIGSGDGQVHKSRYSHAPDTQEPSGESDQGVKDRCRSTTHRHHHHHHHHRRKHRAPPEERPPATEPPEQPEPPRRCHTHAPRHVPRAPSLSDCHDDRGPLFEHADRKGNTVNVARGGGHEVSSLSPSSSSPVPLSSRSSRRSRRSSAASLVTDCQLRTILSSLFGQVK